jgi:ABC-type amino acid transport substrate-binding protein
VTYHPGLRLKSRSGPLLFVFYCWLFVICCGGCASADDTWERVLESGVLRVGMDASLPPFEYVAAGGTLAGLDVDLAQELGRRLGVEVQFVANLPYDGLYDALAVGRVDVLISALVVNPDRMADFAYSASYFDAGQVLVVSPSSVSSAGGIEKMADLGDCALAVEFGTEGDLEARKWARRLSGLTVIQYQTAKEAVAAVVAGKVDAALVDHVSALAVIGSESGLAIVETPVIEQLYAVAVHQDSRHLLRAINGTLADIAADGTMESLVDEWLRKGA